MADLWRDIQYAARTLRKAPGFAALAILLASWFPARRAASLDIADALRYE